MRFSPWGTSLIQPVQCSNELSVYAHAAGRSGWRSKCPLMYVSPPQWRLSTLSDARAPSASHQAMSTKTLSVPYTILKAGVMVITGAVESDPSGSGRRWPSDVLVTEKRDVLLASLAF